MSDLEKTRRLSPKEKAAQNPRNIKLAVAAYCYHDCMHEDAVNSHSTKFAIKNCTSKDCQLWLFRGWQDVSGGTVGKRGKTTG